METNTWELEVNWIGYRNGVPVKFKAEANAEQADIDVVIPSSEHTPKGCPT